MNWRNDPRIQENLEKATLGSLLKLQFQRIYGKNEVEEMERALKTAFKKYDKKDILFEKNIRPGLSHTPETLLVLSTLFIKLGDLRMACELLWQSASLAIEEFINDRQLNVKLSTYDGKANFTRELSNELGNRFSGLEACHYSFFSNSHDAFRVTAAFKQAEKFVEQLRAFKLTEKQKKKNWSKTILMNS